MISNTYRVRGLLSSHAKVTQTYSKLKMNEAMVNNLYRQIQKEINKIYYEYAFEYRHHVNVENIHCTLYLNNEKGDIQTQQIDFEHFKEVLSHFSDPNEDWYIGVMEIRFKYSVKD